jgi:uncharacterized protein with HEPN domain
LKYGRSYVRDMVDAAHRIVEFTSLDRDAFMSSALHQSAVVRQFEIFGEASKRVPELIKQRWPSVPWKDIAGLRDKLIHDYLGVHVDLLWKYAKEDIPGDIARLEAILEALEAETQ